MKILKYCEDQRNSACAFAFPKQTYILSRSHYSKVSNPLLLLLAIAQGMAAVPVIPGSDLAGYSGKWGAPSYFPTLLPMKMQEKELNHHFFYCQWFQSLWEWKPWNLPNQQFNKWRLWCSNEVGVLLHQPTACRVGGSVQLHCRYLLWLKMAPKKCDRHCMVTLLCFFQEPPAQTSFCFHSRL